MQQNLIFPQKLPKDFHGLIKSKTLLRQSNQNNKIQQIYAHNQNSDSSSKIAKRNLTLNGWKKMRSDHEVNEQNKAILLNPAKVSYDNPQWRKTTYFYHQKSLQKPKEKDLKLYGVFGQEKQFTKRNIFPKFDKGPLQFNWPESFHETSTSTRLNFLKNNFAQKIGTRVRNIQSNYELKDREYVCPKIGFLETRQFSRPGTEIKIGHNTRIDTNKIA